jgi:hypothetical protein
MQIIIIKIIIDLLKSFDVSGSSCGLALLTVEDSVPNPSFNEALQSLLRLKVTFESLL